MKVRILENYLRMEVLKIGVLKFFLKIEFLKIKFEYGYFGKLFENESFEN